MRATTALASAGALAALVAASMTVPATAAPVKAQAAACPAAMPVKDVTAGMTGEGLTVVKGDNPEAFKVEVVGVLDDGIGADRDMIIVNITDYPGQHVIDQGGSIWAGMSGSPVYIGDKLLGSLSYGFSGSPSPLAGVTPAEDMYKVLDLKSPAVQAQPKLRANKVVKLSATTKAKLAKEAGTAVPKGALQQLPVPMGVSGLSPKRINRLQSDADAAGLGVKVYAAGKRAAPQAAAPTATPRPGGNFAAMVSYGDVSLSALGTTTAVCGNQALAFGHPFLFSGPANYGANGAQAIAIVKDDVFGPYKMANISGDFGTVDQDRLTAVRADLTKTPATAALTTNITNADTGQTRTGTTQVVDQNFLSTALVYAVWNNYATTLDEFGDGVATGDWTISGTRAGGKAFTVSRKNRFADQDDVTNQPAFDVAEAADALVTNEYEPVTINSVTFDSTASTKFDQLSITKLAVKVNGHAYSSAKSFRVKVGDKLRLKVTLRPYRSTTTTTTTLALTVPKAARGRSGVLSATGGLDYGSDDEEFDSECFLTGDCDDEPEGSLDSVIKSLTSTPRNDAVVADLSIESDEGDEAPVASSTKLKTRVVNGSKGVHLSVRR